MGLITTQHAGFGSPKPKPEQKADPKPVRGFNYAGQPMKEGEYYNGRPEHMEPEPEEKPKLTREEANRLPERRQENRAKAYAQHARERAEGLPSGEGWASVKKKPGPNTKWYWTKERRAAAREKALARLEQQKAEQEMKKANPENSSG